MNTFAQNLRNQITADREINRLRGLFQHNPDDSYETTLSYAEAKELGFEVYSSQRDGVYVSLPKSYYGPYS